MTPGKIEQTSILRLSPDFALRTMEFSENPEANKKYIVARQLLKAANSTGASPECRNLALFANFK
jgi:hypothetical protein